MAIYRVPSKFAVGQRVTPRDRHTGTGYRVGVVTAQCGDSVSVQWQPCGCHYVVSESSIWHHGDANGWTDREYRVAREDTTSPDRARDVEAERVQRYPDAPFSPAS